MTLQPARPYLPLNMGRGRQFHTVICQNLPRKAPGYMYLTGMDASPDFRRRRNHQPPLYPELPLKAALYPEVSRSMKLALCMAPLPQQR